MLQQSNSHPLVNIAKQSCNIRGKLVSIVGNVNALNNNNNNNNNDLVFNANY